MQRQARSARILAPAAALAAQPVAWQMRFQPAATDIMEQITWFEHYTLWFIIPITLLVLALLAWCICQVPRQRQSGPLAHQPQHADRGDLDRRPGRRSAVHRHAVVPAADRAVHAAGRSQADDQGDRQPVELGLRVPGRGAALLQLGHPAGRRPRRGRQGRPRGLSAPAGRRQRGGRAGQHHGARAGDRRRRHPRLRHAGLRHQDRRRAGPHQRDLVQGRRRKASTTASAPSFAARTTPSCRSPSASSARRSTTTWLRRCQDRSAAAPTRR